MERQKGGEKRRREKRRESGEVSRGRGKRVLSRGRGKRESGEVSTWDNFESFHCHLSFFLFSEVEETNGEAEVTGVGCVQTEESERK